MKNREEIQKELQELSPFLSKLKAREQAAEVPENYFHALPDQIWEQIKWQTPLEHTVKRASIWESVLNALQNILQPRVAVALATFVLLIISGIYFLQPNDMGIPKSGNELTAEEIASYIHENLHEFDTELLMKATADLPDQSILPDGELSEEEIDLMLEEMVKDLDVNTLEEML